MMMLQQRAFGSFTDYQTAESALIELKASGFMMDRVSLIGRDVDRQSEVSGANTSQTITDLGNTHDRDDRAGETAKNGAIAGTAFGSVTGLLVGLGALAIPGVGPVMLAGAAATALATAASGGAIGAAAGSLVGGLVGLGIPDDLASGYSDRVAAGNYLVIVEGSAAEIDRAAGIFTQRGIHDWYVTELPTDPNHLASPVQTQYLEH
jgi:hypothetical protein